MKIIGRVEKISFLNWEIEELPIKIDTGAYTSSIHCNHIMEQDGTLEFKLLCPDTKKYNGKLIRTTSYSKKVIRSSNGQKEERYIVDTTVVFFGKKYKMKFSLADRSKMTTPALMGRKFLTKKFIVDVSQENITSKKT
ncbi:RimK/LysX family protein [Tenacibaculum maritimum]|uniref:ATP-dependent zinc protease family protein n=1 Tax=Tenacibaculum maritimum TaxID=107401 RepID=UPI0012E4A220|nr:RimK/LysX family protein [Tenacibaculum maritimum]CAA0193640.1 conserved hypothetical protein [Tenacibaculum maritimum]CAA0197042.1 conserved hypothetical protein [Tenacibaculum maritimum]